MNERNLLCFIKVYQSGNIHKAAKELFLSAQAVSKIISKMEEELGENLFVRAKEGLYPTAFADKLKERAEIILNQYQLIRQDTTNFENENIVVLRIASTYAVLKYLTLDFIKGFYEEYPNIHLNFVEYPEEPIYKMMEKGQLDLAFLPDPVDANVCEFFYCFSHPYCLVMNNNHPLTKKKILEYKDLNNYPLIVKGREYAFFTTNISRFVQGGLDPQILFETSDDELIVEAAKDNWSIGITADYLAKMYCDDNTEMRYFKDKEYVRKIFLTWKKYTKPSKSANCFIKYLREWLRNKDVCQ